MTPNVQEIGIAVQRLRAVIQSKKKGNKPFSLGSDDASALVEKVLAGREKDEADLAEPIRQAGLAVFNAGGISAMKKFHAEIGRTFDAHVAERLSIEWEGIGGWAV